MKLIGKPMPFDIEKRPTSWAYTFDLSETRRPLRRVLMEPTYKDARIEIWYDPVDAAMTIVMHPHAANTMLVGLRALSHSLGLSRPWLRDEAKHGRIPCLQVGSRTLFNLDAVKSALAGRATACLPAVNDAPKVIPGDPQ